MERRTDGHMLDGRLRHRIRVRVRLGKCLVEVELSQQHEIADTARVLSQQHVIADAGRCLGIRCNIWARSKRRSEITHALQGGGHHNIGWGALRSQDLAGAEETRFDKSRVLVSLPSEEDCKLSP